MIHYTPFTNEESNPFILDVSKGKIKQIFKSRIPLGRGSKLEA